MAKVTIEVDALNANSVRSAFIVADGLMRLHGYKISVEAPKPKAEEVKPLDKKA